MKTKRMDEMTWFDIKAALESGVDTVVFGIGSTEQHGPSLPLQTDRRIADITANMIATNIENVLQAPTINIGYSDYHLSFPGTISLAKSTLKSIINDYIVSLAHHGFKNIIITNHHGGNRDAIEDCICEMKTKYPSLRFISFFDQNTTQALGELCKRFQITPGQMGSHAGDMETSIMMFLEEGLVRSDRFVKGYTNGMTAELRTRAHREGFVCLDKNGVIGDQTAASKEKGAIYFDTLKNVIIDYVKGELDR